MKLARLELSGFKSFADYTEFVFDDGVTGIVGPNGCGKSNVVDAVKWVLGEMSARSLRGDAMMDVIFSGSGSRKPMGMAEVSLTFTNEDRRLPLDHATVKVTRRLYRDGTSEYLVNNAMARLKDIRELFLDTGVGVDAYSLIEQGRVSALLEANAQDRREIFEEAAGVSRFKLRKKEASRKLEKTEQNLQQCRLVLEEVEKQLRSVKLQAGKARNYQDYATRLRELRSAYALREYDQLHQKLRQLSERRDALLDTAAVVQRDLATARSAQEDSQMELDAVQAALHAAERAMLTAENQRQAAQQQRRFAQQQIETLTAQRQQHEGRAENLNDQQTAAGQAIDALEKQIAEIDQTVLEREAEVTEATGRQEQAAKAIAQINRALDEQKARAVDLLRQTARVNNEINGIKIQQENLGRQKERLVGRQSQVAAQLQELFTAEEQHKQQKAALEGQAAGLQEDASAVRTRQEQASRRHAELSDQLARQREARSGAVSRRNVLQDLQNRREGVNQAARDVLKARDAGNGFTYVQGLVADIFSTDVQFAPAIEAALGDCVHAVVAQCGKAVLENAAAWQALAGRVQVLCLDRLADGQELAAGAAGVAEPAGPVGQPFAQQESLDFPPPEDAAFGDAAPQDPPVAAPTVTPALTIIECDPKFAHLARHLFGRTSIVQTVADAVELARCSPVGWRFVTRAGQVVEAGGVWQLGDVSRKPGAITRRSELKQLDAQIADLETRVADLTAQLAECDQDSRQLNNRQQELREAVYQAGRQTAEVNTRLQQTQQQAARVRAEAPLLAGEMESLDRQHVQNETRQQELAQTHAKLEEDARTVEQQVHAMGAQVIVQQHAISEMSEAATQARVALSQVREQRVARTRELGHHRQMLAQAQQELKRLQADAQAIAARIEESAAIISQSDLAVAEHQAACEAHAVKMGEHSARLTLVKEELAQQASAANGLEGQGQALVAEEQQLSLACNDASVRIETLVTRTQEEMQIDLPDAHRGYQGAEMNWELVADEIQQLKDKIARLGNVNLDAIDQQQQLDQRQAFITAQLADIAEAQRQLQEIIEKMNTDSHQRFLDTFNAVRLEFQEMFRKLFGGGKADVILENPDDVLESGIEIMARPPGKELQSISLLSGGEKTMTAVALVLSIFKSKPSPFCILDEVDAALDEANTGRFAAIVQEFLTHSQFIIITHNKRSMSIANVLYGVTMQEQGVSKRVAVQFDSRNAAAAKPLPAPAPHEAVAQAAA